MSRFYARALLRLTTTVLALLLVMALLPGITLGQTETPETTPEATGEAELTYDYTPPSITIYVVGQGANVRAEPTTDAEILGSVVQNASLNVTGLELVDEQLWYGVEFEDATGWVFGGTSRMAVVWNPVRETIGGAEMLLVPPGCFLMGSDRGEEDELPVHVQCFDEPFWIDRYEVSNADFGSAGYFAADALPRESITWFEARDYCVARGARLPTEAEWEFAARGPYSLIYPWGNEFVDENAVSSWQVTARETEPVDARSGGVSWVGAYNMSGNVWEWTSSLYGPYPFDAEDGRQYQDDEFSPRVVRGGACCSYVIADVRAAYRFALDPYTIDPNVGVRCAQSYQDGLRQLEAESFG